MQLFHNYHQNRLYRALVSDLGKFDFSIWLHVFAYSLIAIYIPIFLLELGYSLQTVIAYFILYHLIDIPLNFFARSLVKKIGARLVIFLGVLALVAFFILLYNLQVDAWPLLIILAIFSALYDSLFWVAHIFFFLKCSQKDKNVSTDASWLLIARMLAGVLAPLFGAVVIIFLHQQILMIISVTLLLISLWPLMLIKDIKDKPIQKVLSIKEFFSEPKRLLNYIYTGLFGVNDSVESVIWPVFIFLIFKNVGSVAVLPIIISLTTMIFVYFVGRTDKEKRTKAILTGAIFIALLWVLRLLITDPIWYYASVFLMSLATVTISIPLESNLYEAGEEIDTLSTAMFRNIFSMGIRLLLFIAMYFLVADLRYGFVIAIVAVIILFALNFYFRKNRVKN